MMRDKQGDSQPQKQKQIQACPRCGSTAGYYRKLRYTDISYEYYDFANQPISKPYITYYASARTIEGKTKYCVQCHRRVGIAK